MTKTARETLLEMATRCTSTHFCIEDEVTRTLSALRELIKEERPEDIEDTSLLFYGGAVCNKALKEYDKVIDEVMK